jgi:hypothetical protein
MYQILPFLIVIGGFVIAAFLSERALSKLSTEQKAQSMVAFSTARRIHLAAVVLFALLAVWRPAIAWVLIGLYFIVATIWGVSRLLGLGLPHAARNLFLAGQLVVASGIVVCAVIMLARLGLW